MEAVVPFRHGVTATINPLVKTDVLIFYIGAKNTLALTTRSTAAITSSRQIYGGSDQATIVADGSEIDMSTFNGIEIVVGVTDGGDGSNNISMLSPVCQTLEKTQSQNKTVATCSSGSHTWVYFLVTDGGKTKIKEYDLVDGGSITLPEDKLPDVAANCSLSAYYDEASDNRFVLYQSSSVDGSMKEYNINTGSNNEIFATKSALLDNTATAVTTGAGEVFLYGIRTRTNKLVRATKVNGQWQNNLKNQEQTDTVHPKSRLAAVTSPDPNDKNKGSNTVFYFADGKVGIQTHGDTWKAPASSS